MTAKTLIAALSATLLAVPAIAQTTWTAEGARGGSGGGTIECARGDGAVTCQSESAWTGPRGGDWTGSGSRVFEPGQVTGERVATGPLGRERTLNWRRDR